MSMRHSDSSKQNCWYAFVIVSLVVLLTISETSSYSESWVVKSLPGFSGDLPFKLHTGYIGVGKKEELQLFYYFVESEHNPESDPLMLWLTGGPGCTTLSSFFEEHLGPLSFNNNTGLDWRTDVLPLQLNPYSWTKFANIIFVDSPVSTGFSYATTAESYYIVDKVASQHLYEFVQKWFMVHPQFVTNPFYVGASSYSGMIAPIVTQEIVIGNEDESGSQINIKGYVLASPISDPYNIERIGKIDFLRRVSILSDEFYKLIKVSCGPYSNASSAECDKNMGYAAYLIRSINTQHILEASIPNQRDIPPDYIDLAISNWVNNARVREALHVRKGTVGNLTRCNPSVQHYRSYNATVLSTIAYHQFLTNQPLRALMLCGDQDLNPSYVGMLRWIKTLNAKIYDYWRPWFVNEQVAGYVTDYSNGHYNLTFTTIKGAGHLPSTYYPKESSILFQKWLASNPL